MTLPYSPNEGDPAPSPPVQDVVPPGERSQDELRSEIAHDVTSFPSRPLSHAEQEAAEHDAPRSERVYAPASERVPKPPVPGHRDLVEHPDASTPERQATPTPSTAELPNGTVRHSRGRRRVRIPLGSAVREHEDATTRQRLGIGLGWLGLFVCGAAGMWLYLRWQRERNRPLSRLQRQARWAADELRSADPSTTAMGAAAALLSAGLVVWRRLHAGQGGAAAAANDQAAAWQRRVTAFLDRRLPRRVEAHASLSVK